MATIKISKKSHNILKGISSVFGVSMQVILDDAVEQYQRKELMGQINADFLKLKKNNKLWKDELDERKEWDLSMTDD